MLDLKSGGRGFKSRFDYLAGVVSRQTLVQLLPQLGFLNLLCLVDIFVSFSLSDMPVNYLGVAKPIDYYVQQHLNTRYLPSENLSQM